MTIKAKYFALLLTVAGVGAAADLFAEEIDRAWRTLDPMIHCADAAEKAHCAELLGLVDNDQIARRQELITPDDPTVAAEVERVDAENLERVIEILESEGWPRKSRVGQRAANAVWTIIQHSDLATQERFIEMMKKASEQGDLSPSLLALTVDRIRVRQNKPQIYGTQFREVDGKLIPEPIDDLEHVDERRAEVGLQPLSEYEALMNQFYVGQTAPKEAAPAEPQ